MAVEVKVPDIGDFSNVPVISILVKVGDTVAKEDPLIELESDKATMEVPSPVAGKVAAISVSEGDKVSEGSTILTVEADGVTAADAPAMDAPAMDAPAMDASAAGVSAAGVSAVACRCSPRPWMPRRIVWPARKNTGCGFCPMPTPGGVPVAITSPGCRLMNWLMYDTSVATSKIMVRVLPCW